MLGSRRLLIILGCLVAGVTMELGFVLFKPKPDLGDFAVEGGFGELEPVRIEVMYAGLQPRRDLRLTPDRGAVRDFRYTTWTDSGSRIATSDVSAEAETRMTVRGKIAEVREDGSFVWEWKVKEAEVVSFAVQGEMGQKSGDDLLAGLKGLKGRSVVDDKGYLLGASLLGGGKGSTKELRQGIAQALGEPSVHLPDEPIGERAMWVVHRAVVRDGIELQSRERFELMKLRDDELAVRVQASETAGRQTLQDQNVMGLLNISTDLNSLTGTGAGEWTFGLTDALPFKGEGWGERRMQMIMSMSGLEGDIDVVVKMETAVDPM